MVKKSGRRTGRTHTAEFKARVALAASCVAGRAAALGAAQLRSSTTRRPWYRLHNAALMPILLPSDSVRAMRSSLVDHNHDRTTSS